MLPSQLWCTRASPPLLKTSVQPRARRDSSCALFSILLWRGVITDAAGAGTRGWMRPQPTAQTVSKSAALMSSTLPFKLPMQLLRFHPSNVQMLLLPSPLSSPLPLPLLLLLILCTRSMTPQSLLQTRTRLFWGKLIHFVSRRAAKQPTLPQNC